MIKKARGEKKWCKKKKKRGFPLVYALAAEKKLEPKNDTQKKQKETNLSREKDGVQKERNCGQND